MARRGESHVCKEEEEEREDEMGEERVGPTPTQMLAVVKEERRGVVLPATPNKQRTEGAERERGEGVFLFENHGQCVQSCI